jgi:hypothetical protein
MPFDGVIRQPSPAITALDEMIEFFESRSNSWTSGRLCQGNRRNPTSMCLRGALNYVVFGNARSFFIWQRKNKKLWYELHNAMSAVAYKYYGRNQYINVNDQMLQHRHDAIRFLRQTQDYLLQA